MNRTVLIGAVLVVVAIAGYYQFSYMPAQRAAEEAAASAKAAADTEAAAAAKAAADAEAAAKAATDAAATAATDAAGAATEAATDAAAAVGTAATEAAGAAAGAATEAAGAMTDAANDAASTVADAAGMVWDSSKLTADEIIARINAAPIADSMKQTLTTSFNAVKDNPNGVQTVLDQLKQAMGL